MKVKSLLSAFVISCSFASGVVLPAVSPAEASSNYQDGMRMMQARQYARAVASFEQALRENPKDQNSYYCLGTCYYNMKDMNNAKSYYTSAVRIAAATPTGKAAMQALKSLEQLERKSGASSIKTISSSGGQPQQASSGSAANSTVAIKSLKKASREDDDLPNDIHTLPTDTRVRFHRKPESGQDHLYVEASVNNRPITMMFDTGAEMCSFGFNHLQQLGIPIPTGKPSGMSLGLGSSGPQANWTIYTTLRVGNIERKNFPISVQKSLGVDPLLGQSFFKAFHYTVEADSNPETGAIHFTRNTGRQVGSIYRQRETGAEVPFTREGREMLVNMTINGRSVPMYFDTGAAGVTLSKDLAKSVGITIPEDAEEGYDRGASGESKSWTFPVRSAKLGPIEKTNFNIRVVEDLPMKRGLVGQTLFGDWRYTIDSTNNIIKFKR
ncbi:MAG: retroviral-like aspartic protease family protein [Candidatus Melainabacteria bacterium]|nr:retroviral-like aspartic protease family protein [Candidatus Melainabacteria bacterium]